MPKRSYVDNEQMLAEMGSMPAPPRKKARSSNIVVGVTTSEANLKREDDSERRESDDERQDDRQEASRESVTSRARAATRVAPSKGIILRSGRIRLPDKLIQYLNNGVAPESLFWQSDGQGFSIDCENVQTDLLDKYFHGTKLSSFLRSLNRWGFKRLFYHSMPKTTLSFHHPLFRKDAPDLCKDMNMGPGSAGCATAAPAPQAAEVTKEEAKPAPVETTVEVDSLPSASPAIQVLSMPAVATAPAISLPPPHNPVAALNLAGLAARPPPAPASGLQAIIEQMRAQVAADAANKDRLLREALAAEQQRTALLAQANNNNNQASSTGNPLAILETLTSLMSAGQPSVAPNAQLLALARALASPPALPVPPAAPPAQPPQPPAGSLLQLLTPAQQLELLTKLAGSK